ncbi:20469_t:CDS:1, partial [Racocetra persica]
MTSKKYTSKKAPSNKRTPNGFILYKNTNRLSPHVASKKYNLETKDVRMAFERQAEMMRLGSVSNFINPDAKFYKNIYAQMSSIAQKKAVPHHDDGFKDPHDMKLIAEMMQLESKLNFVNLDANFYKNAYAPMSLTAQKKAVSLSNNSSKDPSSTELIAENKIALCV